MLEGVFAVSLSIAASGELLVTGRLKDGQTSSKTSSVYAVDRTTHAVRTMDAVPAAAGLWSVTAYRGCFVGYESGDTVDSSLPNLGVAPSPTGRSPGRRPRSRSTTSC